MKDNRDQRARPSPQLSIKPTQTRSSMGENDSFTIIGGGIAIHNFAIHRAQLHRVLLNQLPPNALQTGKRAVGLTQLADGVRVHFEDEITHQTAYLLVADGIHSPLRPQLLADLAPRYAGYTCWQAVID